MRVPCQCRGRKLCSIRALPIHLIRHFCYRTHLLATCHFLTDNTLQSADKDRQEIRAVAEKPHDAVVKFDRYRNV